MFGTLWIVFATLTTLVLFLYRQVERAYTEAAGPQPAPLAPGVEAPDIEVLDTEAPDGMAPLPFPVSTDVSILAFASTSCKACENVLRLLAEGSALAGPVTAVISGEGYHEFLERQDERFRVFWLAHPPDASHLYGVTIVPFVYALRGKTILSSRIARSEAEVRELLDEARMIDAQLSVARGRDLEGGVSADGALSPAGETAT